MDMTILLTLRCSIIYFSETYICLVSIKVKHKGTQLKPVKKWEVFEIGVLT